MLLTPAITKKLIKTMYSDTATDQSLLFIVTYFRTNTELSVEVKTICTVILGSGAESRS